MEPSMMSQNNCAGCHQLISVSEKLQLLKCSVSGCSKNYHFPCVGMSKENYTKLSSKAKSSWKCPDHKISRNKNDETPAKGVIMGIEDEKISIEKIIDTRFSELESNTSTRLDTILTSQKSFQSTLEAWKNDFMRIPEIITSMEFMSSKFDDLFREVTQLRSESSSLRTENAKLHEEVQSLNFRVSVLEQVSRESNVEIQCVPEQANESLATTIVQLGNVVKCPIQESEILMCTRVAKTNRQSDRPKNIVVRFPSPRIRDSLLAACLKYNKANHQNKLSSADLGIGGKKQQIYVVEHLSPSNRALQAQARAFKKEKGYKFLWVRNGRVLLRKDDAKPVIWVKSIETLSALKD